MPVKTRFFEYDHEIEALAADRADHAFDIGTLPRRPRCRKHLFERDCERRSASVASASCVRGGRPVRRNVPTVRGETRMPSFRFSSLAIRSSPQVTFATAISRISLRKPFGKGGLPVALDLHR